MSSAHTRSLLVSVKMLEYMMGVLSGGAPTKKQLSRGMLVDACRKMEGKFDPNSSKSWEELCFTVWQRKESQGDTRIKVRRLKRFFEKNPEVYYELKGKEVNKTEATTDLEKNEPVNASAIDDNEGNKENDDPWYPAQPIVREATFSLEESSWHRLKTSVSGRTIKETNSTDMLRKHLKESNPFCTFAFRYHKAYLTKTGSLRIHGKAYCTNTPCTLSALIRLQNENLFKVAYSGKIQHCSLKSQQLKGDRRAAMQAILKATGPRCLYLEKLGQIPKNVYESGNRDAVPSTAVLRRARHEAMKIRVPSEECVWESLYETRREQVKSSRASTVHGTLQRVSQLPPGIMMWSEETIRVFHDRAKEDVVFADATGSILNKHQDGRPFYIYEIVVRHPVKGNVPLAVASFVSNVHNVEAIANFFQQFRKDEIKVCSSSSPKLIICDGSMALIRSLLLVYMQEDLNSYANRCFRVVTGKGSRDDLKRPFLHLCSSHIMKSAKDLFSKHKGRKEELMYIIGLMVTCTSLSELAEIVCEMTVLLCSKSQTRAQTAWDSLKSKMISRKTTKFEGENAEIENADIDEPLLDISDNPFARYFSNFVDSAKFEASELPDAPKHKFYGPDILQTFQKNWIPKIFLWSALMIGDLGRFGCLPQYVEYSKFFGRLCLKQSQNLTRSNRTQGIMEKSQQELKRTRMMGRRFRRFDEIAVLYHDFHDSLLREYKDILKKSRKRKCAESDDLETWKKRNRVTGNINNIGKYFQPPTKQLRETNRKQVQISCNDSTKTPMTVIAGRQCQILPGQIKPGEESKVVEAISSNMKVKYDETQDIEHGNKTEVVITKSLRFSAASKTIPLPQKIPKERAGEIAKPRIWLNSDDIDYAMHLMHRQFPAIGGLQSSVLYTPGCIVPAHTPNGKFVQILHVRSNHWIALSNVFSIDQNSVYVYDSLLMTYSNAEVAQISRLMRPSGNNISLKFPQVQQQSPGTGNCGIFAIAYCISLCFDTRPERVIFLEQSLRKDISEMLVKGVLTSKFRERHGKLRDETVIQTAVYCKCRLAYDNEMMICCSMCSEWYHPRCLSTVIPDLAIAEIDEEWRCDRCRTS